jgi:hypothetical protein
MRYEVCKPQRGATKLTQGKTLRSSAYSLLRVSCTRIKKNSTIKTVQRNEAHTSAHHSSGRQATEEAKRDGVALIFYLAHLES